MTKAEVNSLLVLFSTVPLPDGALSTVPWDAVPTDLHDWLQADLYGSQCPIDGIYRCDFERAWRRLAEVKSGQK
mgnify:CR=1 FL=1|tara:strand:+ start:95 stop:316 length:222 start_codon:yes stop_codon:yes gene_type:complete